MVDATVRVGNNAKYQGLGAAVRDVCGPGLSWSEINAIASRAAYDKGVSNPNNVPPGSYNITCSAEGRGYVGNTDSLRPAQRFDRQPPPPRDYADSGDRLMQMFGVSPEGIYWARADAHKAADDFAAAQRKALTYGDFNIKLRNHTKLLASKAVPVPYMMVNGRKVLTKIVVSLKQNLTYVFNDDGIITEIYQNGSGRSGLDTEPGLRRITGIEHFPYAAGKRAEDNWRGGASPYGPYAIINDVIDPETGRLIEHSNQLLHGTNAPHKLGGKVSHGCIRHENNAIYAIKDSVSRGDYIHIISDENDFDPVIDNRSRKNENAVSNFFERVFGN